MGAVSRIRPRIGDVIEIETPHGFGYAQYTHKHSNPPVFGALLRVLPGLFSDRPTEFGALVKMKERFLVFFPLGAACNRRIVRIVAEEQVPDTAKHFPLFRTGIADRAGHVRVWFLWDGENEWPVGDLTEEQKRLPIRPGVWNDTMLIERVANGWAPN